MKQIRSEYIKDVLKLNPDVKKISINRWKYFDDITPTIRLRGLGGIPHDGIIISDKSYINMLNVGKLQMHNGEIYFIHYYNERGIRREQSGINIYPEDFNPSYIVSTPKINTLIKRPDIFAHAINLCIDQDYMSKIDIHAHHERSINNYYKELLTLRGIENEEKYVLEYCYEHGYVLESFVDVQQIAAVALTLNHRM